jgi:hypothetical protein
MACEPGQKDQDDPLLAKVYNQELRLSGVEYLLEGQNEADSMMILRSYVENWVRDAVFLNEAEKNQPDDMDIDDLVKDYRASLIVNNYEKILVERLLDTAITEQELIEYYEKNKDQYQLESTIVRCHFVKIKKPAQNRDSLRRWWDAEEDRSFGELIKYCNEYAEFFILDDSTWYKVEEIESLLPSGTLSQRNIRPSRSLRFTDDQYEYYLRVLESVRNKEIAPLSYIREQAIRFIMHRRKLDLLDRLKQELYNSEISGNQIKVYLQ